MRLAGGDCGVTLEFCLLQDVNDFFFLIEPKQSVIKHLLQLDLSLASQALSPGELTGCKLALLLSSLQMDFFPLKDCSIPISTQTPGIVLC